MKRILAAVLALFVALMLFPISGLAQSMEEGFRLLNEANKLRETAQTGADLRITVQKYELSLRILEKNGMDSAVGSVALILATCYARLRQYDKALELYEKSLIIERKLKDVASEGRALSGIAGVYEARGEHAKALELYEKSLIIERKLKDVAGEGRALSGIARVYEVRGEHTKALEMHEKSLAIKRRLQDVAGEGRTIGVMADVYRRRGEYAKALEMYEEAIFISRKLQDAAGEGTNLNDMAIVYMDRGEYDKALELYEKSLAIKRRLQDVVAQGKTLANMATVYENRGEYDRALELYEKSLAISRRFQDVADEAKTLHNIAIVYRNRGQYDKALELYEKAISISRKLQAVALEASSLWGIGDIHAAEGRYDQALSAYEQCLAIRKRIGEPTAGVVGRIGLVRLEKGDLKAAEALLREANVAPSLGLLSLRKGDYQGALDSYTRNSEWAEHNRNADDLFTSRTGMGLAYEGLGDLAKAAEWYQKAVELTEDLRSSLGPEHREKFLNVKVNGLYRTAAYKGLAQVLVKQGKFPAAFQQSEYTKARVFAEAMARRAGVSSTDVPQDVLEKERQLTDTLAALNKQLKLAYEKNNKDVVSHLEPQVKEAKEQLATHVNLLRNRYPLYAATKYPSPMALAQTLLREDEWVLAYDVTDSGVLIYVTRGKQVLKALVKPIPREDVDALVRTYRQPLDMQEGISRQKLASFDLRTGKKLADILLSDALDLIPKNAPLIIVPDDSLGVLPFEMLVLNSSGRMTTDGKIPTPAGAEFFGDRNPISYYQSLTALTLARTFGTQRGSFPKKLVMDDPVFGPDDERLKQMKQNQRRQLVGSLPDKLLSAKKGLNLSFPPLPLTKNLGESLVAFDRPNTERHTGLAAAKPLLFGKPLTGYGSMVFATHGYFGTDLPGVMEPVLVLTLVDQPPDQDGFLRMSEVMGLKLNADVVALTACQTGLGRRISGEGTMGMGRAFQYAGAKSVLMSLWSVSEKASVNLVENFFKHLKEGKSKLEALKLSRDEMRKAGFDHPFYWAPFILVGEVN